MESDERWFSSTTPADNGPLTGEDEGLSKVVFEENGHLSQVLLRDAVSELKGDLIGETDMEGILQMANVFEILRQSGCPASPYSPQG